MLGRDLPCDNAGRNADLKVEVRHSVRWPVDCASITANSAERESNRDVWNVQL